MVAARTWWLTSAVAVLAVSGCAGDAGSVGGAAARERADRRLEQAATGHAGHDPAGTNASGQAARSGEGHGQRSGEGHGQRSGEGHGQRAGEGHGQRAGQGHGSAARLPAALLSAADLPAGYRPGAGHAHGAAGGPPRPQPGCEVLLRLLAPDGDHASADRVTFSRGHVGPRLTQTVLTLPDEEQAAELVAGAAAAPATCPEFRRSTATQGATTFAVDTAPAPVAGDGVAALRLQALGGDFGGVRWEAAVARVGERVIVVTYYTISGAPSTDLQQVTTAALGLLQAG